jgi:hypothetical protein
LYFTIYRVMNYLKAENFCEGPRCERMEQHAMTRHNLARTTPNPEYLGKSRLSDIRAKSELIPVADFSKEIDSRKPPKSFPAISNQFYLQEEIFDLDLDASVSSKKFSQDDCVYNTDFSFSLRREYNFDVGLIITQELVKEEKASVKLSICCNSNQPDQSKRAG